MPEGYVRLKEAAGYLGVSTETVKRRVGEARVGLGNIPFYQDKPGTVSPLYFKLSELENWRRGMAYERGKRRCFGVVANQV